MKTFITLFIILLTSIVEANAQRVDFYSIADPSLKKGSIKKMVITTYSFRNTQRQTQNIADELEKGFAENDIKVYLLNNNSDDINDLKDKLRETKAKYILLSKPIIFEMEQYYKWTIVEAETGKELYKALLIETMFGNRKNVRKLIADLKEKGII